MAEALRYYKDCVNHDDRDVELLNDCVEREREISRRTFLKYVDSASLHDVERKLGYENAPAKGLMMAGDYHVRYHRSTYAGHPCVYFVHSAIEHLFLPPAAIAELEKRFSRKSGQLELARSCQR